MSDLSVDNKTIPADPETVPAFGYELLRNDLLPDLLGKETPAILYWAGKGLARKYPLENIEQIQDFFIKAGWGTLTVQNETKNELEFELSSQLISERLKKDDQFSFQLEAGFLAQQIERQQNITSETFEHPRKRAGKVQFTVKWDKKDHIR